MNATQTPAAIVTAYRAYTALTAAIRSDYYSHARHNVVLLASEDACYDVARWAEKDCHRTFRVVTAANIHFWSPTDINMLKMASGDRGCTLVISKDCFDDDGAIQGMDGLDSLISKCTILDTTAYMADRKR